MKLTMIGKSDSGKTSFMSGLHERLGENRVNGFYISPTAKNMEEIMKRKGEFDKISFEKLNYKFPDGTTQTTIWSFDLFHKTKPVCELEWIDYRGGILEEVFEYGHTDNGSKDDEIKELIGHISFSNAVLLFADSILLSYYDNPTEWRIHTGAKTINSLMRNYATQYPNRNLTIVIVLTKADSDLIPKEHKENNYKILIERGKKAFSEVIELCKDNNTNWHGGIIPVGVVGDNRCKSTITAKGGSRDFTNKNSPSFMKPITVLTEMTDLPIPLNVEHPLFFTIGSTLEKMKNLSTENYNNYKIQIEKSLSKSNILRDIWCKLTETDNPRQTAEYFTELMKKEQITLQSIEDQIEPILKISKQKIKSLS